VCPVDPIACIVEVHYRGGSYYTGEANEMDWANVVQWKFDRLVNGYTYA